MDDEETEDDIGQKSGESESESKPVKKVNKKSNSAEVRTKEQGGKKSKKSKRRGDSDEDIEKVIPLLPMYIYWHNQIYMEFTSNLWKIQFHSKKLSIQNVFQIKFV